MNNKLIIKIASEADWKLIQDFEIRSKNKFYSTRTSKSEILDYIKRETILIAYLGIIPVAKISYLTLETSIEINGLIVLPDWRGRSIGLYLSKFVINKNPSFNEFFLTVHPNNKFAVTLYENMGFRKINQIENAYGDGEPRILMKLYRNEKN